MKCNDCIYEKMCESRYEREHCLSFKDKANFVEVVRCKNCKFNVANMEIDENDGTDYSGKDIVCSYFMTDGMQENDYCSYGERSEE